MSKNDESRYTFKMESYGDCEIILTGNKVYLPHIVDQFKDWLLGCGFSPISVENIHFDDGEEKTD